MDYSHLHADYLLHQVPFTSWKPYVTVAAIYLVYQLARTIYDVYLGPLSSFPGPKLCAATNIPTFRTLFNGTDSVDKRALHEKYGPVVRIGPNNLSYSDAQAWKDIYGHRTGGKKAFPKDRKFYAKPINGVDSIITTPDEASHSRHRRILAHAFSDKALKEQEPLLKHWAQLLVEKLNEACTKGPQNLVFFYNATTFDIMADLTFAEPLHMLANSDYVPWVKSIFEGIQNGTMFRALTLIPVLSTLLKYNRPLRSYVRKKQRSHFQYSKERVDKRLAKAPEKPDLWSLIMKRADKGDGLSLGEMHSDSSLFMLAGTETTATLLRSVLYPDKDKYSVNFT